MFMIQSNCTLTFSHLHFQNDVIYVKQFDEQTVSMTL